MLDQRQAVGYSPAAVFELTLEARSLSRDLICLILFFSVDAEF